MDSPLKQIADNQLLLDALKAMLVKQFAPPTDYKDIPSAISDELLGQFLRARITGMNAIDEVFKEIATYKTIVPRPPGTNPAR